MAVPSLRELAARLDLSHATVSAALRGGHGVKTSTRDRVLSAARELGYRNNPLASALMSEMRRSRGEVFRGTLALLHPARPETGDPIAALLRRDFVRRAGELGFGVDELPAPVGPEETEKLGQVLSARGVLGVLSLTGDTPFSLSAQVCATLAVLELAHHCAPSPFHRLVIDWSRLLELGFSRLHEQGARRVGLAVDGNLAPSISRALIRAGRATGGYDGEAVSLPTYIGANTPADFSAWLDREKCDALICTRAGFLAALPAGVPGALIADLALGESASVPASCHHRLDLRTRELAAHAADFLVQHILRREFGPPKIRLLSTVAPAWE